MSDSRTPDTEAPDQVTAAPASPSRRRGIIAGIIALGVIVVLVVVALIAESLARQEASRLIADHVRTSLGLEAEHPVEVTIGGFSLLAQAATGRIESVTVDVQNVAFGELVGDLTILATGTPLDAAQPTDRVQAVFRVAESDVAAIAGFLAGSAVSDLELDEREIRFQSGFTIFGVELSVGVGITPEVIDGTLAFAPTSVEFNGERISGDELQDQFGPIVGPLFASREFCVAQYLPRDLALTAVQVGDEQLVVVFGAERVALGGEGFSTFGSCG